MRRKLLLFVIAIIAVLAVIIAFVGNQELIRLKEEEINSHKYPQDSFSEVSNLQIKGVIAEVKENYTAEGMAVGSYHIYRYLVRVNMTGIVWVNEMDAEYMHISIENKTVMGWNTINVGYDNLDNPQFAVGQNVECKGYYESRTDFTNSFLIAVSPSIDESYLKLS